jgi:hypothetical protein
MENFYRPTSPLKNKIRKKNWTQVYEEKLASVHDAINKDRDRMDNGVFHATYVRLPLFDMNVFVCSYMSF